MRLFATLCFCFCLIASLAMSETIYVSSLTNGTPPTLNVARFSRTGAGAFNPQGAISLNLAKAGGVTSIQPNGDTQLHVYRTEQSGNKARVIRETVDVATFSFVAGSTLNYPANLVSVHNFDSNDAVAIGQKQVGKKLHARNVNAAGNPTGGFRGLFSFPASPIFSGHISDAKPFFFSGLWRDPASGRTGVTFANTSGAAKSASFLFTNPIVAHDMSVSFPREASAQTVVSDEDFFCYLIMEERFTPQGAFMVVLIRRFIRTSLGGQTIRVTDFNPTGNPILIAPPRSIGSSTNVASFQFNGCGLDPLAVAIAYLRWNKPLNTNEIVLQTFNPVLGRKIAGVKFVKRASRGFINYGISVFNSNFRNGVTAD
jgi:hypothetical protein